MDETRTSDNEFWKDKKVRLEIIKDGRKLKYTATIINIDDNQITFLDRFGKTYSFNRQLVQEMELLKDEGWR